MLTTILLAAGLSRRMGAANKLLLPFGQSTLIGTTASNLLAAGLGEVLVVLGHDAEKVQAALADLPVQFVENPRFMEGMTASIQAGVAAAHPDSEGYLICPGDMPFVSAADFRRIGDFFAAIFRSHREVIVQPVCEGRRGNPVVFSQFYRQQILENTHPEGCRPVLEQNMENVRFVEMPTDGILRDLDTLEDWQAVRP